MYGGRVLLPVQVEGLASLDPPLRTDDVLSFLVAADPRRAKAGERRELAIRCQRIEDPQAFYAALKKASQEARRAATLCTRTSILCVPDNPFSSASL